MFSGEKRFGREKIQIYRKFFNVKKLEEVNKGKYYKSLNKKVNCFWISKEFQENDSQEHNSQLLKCGKGIWEIAL